MATLYAFLKQKGYTRIRLKRIATSIEKNIIRGIA